MKFDKEKLSHFLKNLIDRTIKHEISTMASSMSYYYLSASIPLMLVITSIIGKYLKGNEQALLEIISLLPIQTQNIIVPMIDSLLTSPNVSTLSIVTIIFAIWSASKGISSLLMSINKAYGLDYKESAIIKKVLSFFYTALLIFVIVIFMIIRMYGPRILEIIDDFLKSINLNNMTDKVFWILNLVNGFLPMLIMIVLMTFLYKIAANRDKEFNISIKEASLGGIFSTLAIFIVSFIYSFFLENISNMSVIYGTLAGFLSLFIWIMIFSYSIILGAEIIAAYKQIKKINLTVIKDKNMDDIK